VRESKEMIQMKRKLRLLLKAGMIEDAEIFEQVLK
jgi:hypothetical protein